MSVELTILVLFITGLALMTLEAFAPTLGLLGLAGAVSFFGALVMLRNIGSFYGIIIDLPLIIALGLIGLAVLGASFYFYLVSRRKALSAGAEIMPGMQARVVEWSGTQGRVHVDGEIWAATGPENLGAGETVTIAARNHLVLTVTKG